MTLKQRDKLGMIRVECYVPHDTLWAKLKTLSEKIYFTPMNLHLKGNKSDGEMLQW